MPLETFENSGIFGKINGVDLGEKKISFRMRKKLVSIPRKEKATLACSKTANIIIITLKILKLMEEKV